MNSLAILTVDNMRVDIIFRQPTCIHGETTDITLFSPHATLSPQCHVITNHITFTTCYHQSSFLCLPYRRKVDVRNSQLLPAVLPVPLIGINTSTAWLSVETTRLLTVELLLHLQEIYIFYNQYLSLYTFCL